MKEIYRVNEDENFVTKRFDKNGDVKEYVTGKKWHHEITITPEGKIKLYDGEIKLKTGETLNMYIDFMTEGKEEPLNNKVLYDKNGNVTVETIQYGRKFSVNMNGPGEIKNVEEIPCTETYYSDLSLTNPELARIIGETGNCDYELNRIAKKIVENSKCTKIFQNIIKSDGTRRISDKNIVTLASCYPEYGTDEFINDGINADEKLNILDFYLYKYV